MSQDTGKDFFQVDSDYAVIGLLSSKINVLVIGAGRAGLIKARSFASKGCTVTAVSLDFTEEFNNLALEYDIRLIKGRHSAVDIDKYHIVVIAVNDTEAIHDIKSYCDNKNKLYLTCHNFREGNFIVPTQGNSKNIYYSINTREGSPITSRFLMERTKSFLNQYDDLVECITYLRRTFKGKEVMKEIMTFVSTEDFNFFLKQGYANMIITMFYGIEN